MREDAEKPGCFGLLRGADVEFEVAGDGDSVWAAADGCEPLGVGLALGEDGGSAG